VSHAVKALEAELAQSLLDRTGRKSRSRPPASTFCIMRKKILADMSVARISLDHRTRWGRAVCGWA